jgi:hypothetical protein
MVPLADIGTVGDSATSDARSRHRNFDSKLNDMGAVSPARMLRVSWFRGTTADRLSRACTAINGRETGKSCKCAAIMIVFRQNPDVV